MKREFYRRGTEFAEFGGCFYQELFTPRPPYYYSAEFAWLAQNLGRRTTEGTEDTEEKAEGKRLMKKTFRTPLSFLCDLCVLCGELSEFFGCGVAALWCEIFFVCS